MTVGEIVTAAMDDVRVMHGVNFFDVVHMVNKAHRSIHEKITVRESLTLVAETFTWDVADGAAKDVSGDLTRWAGRPFSITDGGDTALWDNYPLLQVELWRTTGGANVRSGRVYAVSGDYLVLVNAPDAALSVSVKHYPYPADLADDDDVPVLPYRHHGILITAAREGLWWMAYALETNPTLKRGYGERASLEAGIYERAFRELVNDNAKGSEPLRDFTPPPIYAGAAANVARRRAHRG